MNKKHWLIIAVLIFALDLIWYEDLISIGKAIPFKLTIIYTGFSLASLALYYWLKIFK